jgi:hypothetical protein
MRYFVINSGWNTWHFADCSFPVTEKQNYHPRPMDRHEFKTEMLNRMKIDLYKSYQDDAWKGLLAYEAKAFHYDFEKNERKNINEFTTKWCPDHSNDCRYMGELSHR